MLVNRKCKLMYKIEYEPEENVQAFEEMKETLAQVGVDIILTNGFLILSKSDTKYKEKTSRGAGKKRTAKWCSIIDVLIMLQTMTDKQIYTEIFCIYPCALVWNFTSFFLKFASRNAII